MLTAMLLDVSRSVLRCICCQTSKAKKKRKFLFCPLLFGSFPDFAHLSSFWKEQHVVENEYGAWHDTDGRKPNTALEAWHDTDGRKPNTALGAWHDTDGRKPNTALGEKSVPVHL